MGDLEKATKSIKKNGLIINLALGLLLLANLLNILAFSTTAWGRVYSVSGGGFYGVGLWRICSSGSNAFFVETFCTDTTGWPQDWYAAAQCFAVFGFIGIIGGLVMLLLYLCGTSCKGKADLLFWTAIFILVTAIFYLIGIIIFGVEFDSNYAVSITGFGNRAGLGWSFGVAIVADILAIIVGILLLLQSRKTRSTSPDKEKLFKSSYKANKKDQSPREKNKPVSNATKNKNANNNGNSKPSPVVAKNSSHETPVQEKEENRKTFNTEQPDNTGAASAVHPVPDNTKNEQEDQAKQPKPVNNRRYSQPAREPQGPYKLQRKSIGGQPGATGNTKASPETKPINQGQGKNQQKKDVQPNLNAGKVEVQIAPANTNVRHK